MHDVGVVLRISHDGDVEIGPEGNFDEASLHLANHDCFSKCGLHTFGTTTPHKPVSCSVTQSHRFHPTRTAVPQVIL